MSDLPQQSAAEMIGIYSFLSASCSQVALKFVDHPHNQKQERETMQKEKVCERERERERKEREK